VTRHFPSKPRPAGNFDAFAWFFMRISGLLLIFMALGHLFLMHLGYGIENINYELVVKRYATPFWRTYDLILLILALLHGFNGLRNFVDDYVHSRGFRVIAMTFLYLIGLTFLIIGSMVILTFQPVS
jgi:succinate dehydrogenase / fumarate reductase membrane anchor subunit